MVAFTNTNGGKIIIGVNDKGIPIKNFSIGKETIQNWINTIKIKTEPSLIANITQTELKGKPVVELSIGEFPVKPVSFKGKYYKRVENSNHLLSTVEISNLTLQSLQLSWDSYPAINKTIKDIDQIKVEKFINKVNVAGRVQLEGNYIECLEKLKLISDGKITNACYLLFSKNEIEYNIHYGRFKSESYIIDDKIIQATLFDAVEIVMK